jgi:hypothetical protein
MSSENLVSLLEQSRSNNIEVGITGLLLYMDTLLGGRFIQMLEGSETEVRKMFDTIIADDRHRGVLLLSSGNADHRQFDYWSMGFRSFDAKEIENNPGFTELSKQLFKGPPFLQAEEPVNYLKAFYNINNTK